MPGGAGEGQGTHLSMVEDGVGGWWGRPASGRDRVERLAAGISGSCAPTTFLRVVHKTG
jgi:hypothetical protein